MTRQQITIDPMGGIHGLQVKPGKGVDLRVFGKAKIERASEIVFNEETQRWRIVCCLGVLRGVTVTTQMMTRAEVPADAIPAFVAVSTDSGTGSVIPEWIDYDQAVAAEIEYLNAARRKWGNDFFQ